MTHRRSHRRTEAEPELITIYWRDIPAQVTARYGRAKASAKLSDRFQTAIDGAATRAGLTGDDAYVAEWREERSACTNDLEGEVEARKTELEAHFTPDVLRSYVRSGGVDPDASAGTKTWP